MGHPMINGAPYDKWGLLAKVLDCNILVSDFKLQLCNYIHFWTNNFGKNRNTYTHSLSDGLNSTTPVFLKG